MAVNEDDSGDGADVVMMIMVMLTGVMVMEVMVFLSRPHCKAPMGEQLVLSSRKALVWKDGSSIRWEKMYEEWTL